MTARWILLAIALVTMACSGRTYPPDAGPCWDEKGPDNRRFRCCEVGGKEPPVCVSYRYEVKP